MRVTNDWRAGWTSFGQFVSGIVFLTYIVSLMNCIYSVTAVYSLLSLILLTFELSAPYLIR